jgi:hypothetical protein
MPFYELATLSLRIGSASKAVMAIEADASRYAEGGSLLGCFLAEIGSLDRLVLLRGFPTKESLDAERQRILLCTNPFGCAEYLTALDLEGYAPFPFMHPLQTGQFGPVYEIRTYRLYPGMLAAQIASWERMVRERELRSPLTMVMYALDGTPRMTHIWPYASFEQRGEIRGRAVAEGIWPPKGGAEYIAEQRSGIYLPTRISALR